MEYCENKTLKDIIDTGVKEDEDVGTLLYGAPEVATNAVVGTRYNQKDFPFEKMDKQAHIIRLCMQHNSKNRPTSVDLLKSEWLPAKIEDEHLQEIVRTMVNEADFDIIHSTPAPMVAEAEIIKVVDEILEEFPPLKTNNYCFFVNHTSIVETIFDCCRIPEDIRRGVYNLLGQLDKKFLFDIRGNSLTIKYVNSFYVLIISYDAVLGDLDSISTTLDKLIPAASGASVGRQQIFAVGVNIAVQKIVIALETYQSAISKMIQKKKLEEERNLVRELWAHNIKADFMYEEPTDFTPEILASSCRDKGINWIIIMRHKSQDLYTLRDAVTIFKVKNLILKTEEEAHDNISGIIKNINDGSVPVVAIDVSRELLRKISDCDVLDDESFKCKIFDMVSPQQKEYLSSIQ
ncbi:10838_t:CDS:2, partial [Racocetra fulgida]